MITACSNPIFTTIYVNKVARISFPKDVKRETRRRALKLYQPFSRLPRAAYKLWRHFPLNTAYLTQRSTEIVPRLSDFDWRSWLDTISTELDMSTLFPVFCFPPQEFRKKAFILLFDASERPVACAKLSFDHLSEQFLANEIAAMAFLGKNKFRTFDHPKKLSSGECEDAAYVVLTYGERGLTKSRKWEETYGLMWRELVEKTGQKMVPDRHFWQNLPSNWLNIRDHLEADPRGDQFVHCAVHGDFAPWNIMQGHRRQFLIDWEFFSPRAPFFSDPAHFVLSVNLLTQHRSLEYCSQALKRLAATLQASRKDVALSLAYHAADNRWPEKILYEIARKVVG